MIKRNQCVAESGRITCDRFASGQRLLMEDGAEPVSL
jgi:hypothetical protein